MAFIYMNRDIKDSNFVCIINQHLIIFPASAFLKSSLMSAVALCFEKLENGERGPSLLSPCSTGILNNGIMSGTKCSATVVIKVIAHLFAEAKVIHVPRVSIYRERISP